MSVYRDEIDGLRAVAVIPVILYHAGLTKFMAGGYIGVDIFFVISGYLITSVIENEREEEKFSIVHFYERRCRRILPALFLILFTSSFFAYYWMLPEQLEEFGQTLISIIGLSSNFFFWWKDDGYFTALTELNPLIHTWSLAVEEQFYFLFPLICYFSGKRQRCLIIVLILLAVLSFFFAQWGGNIESISSHHFYLFSQHSWASFYLPLGRAWELLLGSFAAFYLRKNSTVQSTWYKCNELFALIGFVLIIISIVFFDSRYVPPFPNCYTLIPTLGATLIILCGTNSTLVGKLLSIRLFRWVGLISYSAYLWHQPILAFTRLKTYDTSQILPMLIIISIVFLLSGLSYVLIEQPFRNKTRFSRKQIFFGAFIAAMLAFILAVFLIQTATSRSLLDSKKSDPYLSDLRNYGHWQYVVKAFNALQKQKTFSNKTSVTMKKLILIGDSFAQDFYNMAAEGKHLINYEIRVYFIFSRCQIYLGAEDRKQFIEAKHHRTCTNAYEIKYALPLIRQADVIILASNWYEWSAQRLPMTLKLLNLTGQQQAFVIGPKHFGKVYPMVYVSKSTKYRIKQYQYPNTEVIKINNLLEQTIDKEIFVNLQKMICTGYNQTCPLFTRDGKLISHDGAHLTKYGARYVGNIIFKNRPLNKL
ncbi:unnamed protein product [Rotaria socialis]|uniref:Acyltransferase n=1 Tax=Rotaria socialis TaxID=392032 RepID=A0A820LR44_9BILA|nr:unnamed protein product [Rotaria socialis]CAF4361433.1 unnamed protein product [Rotaria socialis]